MHPWDIEGKWAVSSFGWADEVRKVMPLLPQKVNIRNVTFREGDDQPGFRVSIEDKIELLRLWGDPFDHSQGDDAEWPLPQHLRAGHC